MPSYFVLVIRAKTHLDDSLDVVAAHGVGGTVGALLTGVFAEKSLNGLADGLLYGNPGQLAIQATAVGAAIVYSGIATFILLKLVGAVFPLHADADGRERRPRHDAARRRSLRARIGRVRRGRCSAFLASRFPFERDRRDRVTGNAWNGSGAELSDELVQEQADVGHEADGLGRSAVGQFGDDRRVDVHADDRHPGR